MMPDVRLRLKLIIGKKNDGVGCIHLTIRT